MRFDNVSFTCSRSIRAVDAPLSCVFVLRGGVQLQWFLSITEVRRRSIVSQVPTTEITEVVDPVGHVQVIYLGPVAPHWECRMVFGDEEQIQAFVDRIDARLRFLPPHDPQFRRNRERVNRDAERENLLVEWNLGYDEEA